MDQDQTLELFGELAVEVRGLLDASPERGETGGREPGENIQYRHDVVADELIVGRLLAEGFSVLSEESGTQGSGEVLVVVDPIDGSTNAARNLPWYATSLCAIDAEGLSVGYVANLATGDEFKAIRGEGAVGPAGMLTPTKCDRLGDAIVALAGPPGNAEGWAQFRVYGAAALDLCGVAAGWFDGFADPLGAHGPWDYMAALLICREAGVGVVDLDGRDLETTDGAARRGPVAARGSVLLNELLEIFRST